MSPVFANIYPEKLIFRAPAAYNSSVLPVGAGAKVEAYAMLDEAALYLPLHGSRCLEVQIKKPAPEESTAERWLLIFEVFPDVEGGYGGASFITKVGTDD